MTQLSAVRAAAHASPARPASSTATANSGTTSSAYGARAPRPAHPSAAAASGGTATRASHVKPSAVAGSAAIAATTTAIESGSTSDQPVPARRASRFGIPRPGSATSAAWVAISTELAITNCVDTGTTVAAAR